MTLASPGPLGAPVAASALMSLNALAPGRIDFGISTGFTARRTMGVGPVRLADMRRYIEQVQRLIAGETVEPMQPSLEAEQQICALSDDTDQRGDRCRRR